MSHARKRIGALLVLAASASANAAEWSVAPLVSWLADHSSNRVLREGAPASESVGAALELPLVRRSETGELRVSSRYHGQRFSDDVLPDVDDVQLLTYARHDFETSRLEFDSEASRQSTLTTELAETGVIRADSNRRTYGAGLNWHVAHSEEHAFDLSAKFQDVDYTGEARRQLVGYRYASLRAGETFTLSSRSSISLTAFGSDLRSERGGAPDREHGLMAGYSFAWSERTSISASMGASRRDAGAGEETGATGDLSWLHRGETTDWNLSLSRGLVPYGLGVLVERDSAQLRVNRQFGPRLRGSVRAGFARNSDAGPLLRVDTREYGFTNAELGFALTETWSVSVDAGLRRASEANVEAIDGWSVALRTRWEPGARVLGH